MPRWRSLLSCASVCAAVAMVTAIGPASLRAAGRSGQVHLDGRTLADDQGPFLALGATLFWALWGERHDPTRLDENLRWLAARGVDYVRVLGMVGGVSWEDRTIDPDDEEYWPTVDRLIERLGRHGLRMQVTLFAEADAMMPEAHRRTAFADAWADRATRHADRVILLEVANEHWQNGLSEVAELRALGTRLSEQTGTLVALSAPFPGQVCEVYAGSAADIATIHYGRSPDAWQGVRQPWEWPGADVPCRESLPVLVNNEPMGPQSSVSGDSDPLRLVMGFVTTFLAGNAAYVLHTGAGVRGGGANDRALGRAANFADTPALEAALQGIGAARAYLPGDLANWTRHDAGDEGHPFRGFDAAVRDGHAGAVYAATSGTRFVVAVLDARAAVNASAVHALEVDVHDPLTGAVITRHALAPGESLDLGRHDAFVLIGHVH